MSETPDSAYAKGRELGATALEEIGKMLIAAAAEVRSDTPFTLRSQLSGITEETSSVKPLAWTENPETGDWHGRGITGIYVIAFNADERGEWLSVIRPDGEEIAEAVPTDEVDRAKGIAQTSYQKHVRSAIDATTIERLTAERDEAREALLAIDTWAKAYPLSVFPEPDFALAAKLLKDGGITLDAVSASNMRHVLTGIQGLVSAALATESSNG